MADFLDDFWETLGEIPMPILLLLSPIIGTLVVCYMLWQIAKLPFLLVSDVAGWLRRVNRAASG